MKLKFIKKLTLYFLTALILSGYFSLPSPVLAADKMDDNCPINLTLTATPVEVKNWNTPVKLDLSIRRDRGLGYYCSTRDVIQVSYQLSVNGAVQTIRNITKTIEPNPTGSGSPTTVTDTADFDFSQRGATSNTSAVAIVASSGITRTAGYKTTNMEKNSDPVTVRLNGSTTLPQPSPGPAGAGYVPQNVKVCKVSDTSNRIFWTTTEPTNSALEYSKQGEAGIKKIFTTSLKDHSILLSGLTKGTTYGYALYMPVAGQKTSTATSKVLDQNRQFVAGQTQDTGCSADGSKVDNTVTTTPPDTSVGIKSGDFDQVLGSLFNPLETGTTIPSLIVRAINILLTLVGMLSVLFIIIGGFQMVTAGGNETTVAKGKKTVTYAIAGLVVSILSFSIVAIIQSIIS